MLIKVLKTTKASKNQTGLEVFNYEAGNVYDIYSELAEVFITQGWGIKFEEAKEEIIEEIKEEAEEEIILEEKAIENLENKAIENLENKTIKKTTNKKGRK